MLGVLILSGAFCVGIMLGACRPTKQRDKSYRSFQSNFTFSEVRFLEFFLLPQTFTSGEYLET